MKNIARNTITAGLFMFGAATAGSLANASPAVTSPTFHVAHKGHTGKVQTANDSYSRLSEIIYENGKDIIQEHIPDILSHLKEFYDNGGIGSMDLAELLAHAVLAIQEKAQPNEQYIPEFLILLFNVYAGQEQLQTTFERTSSFSTVSLFFAGTSALAAYNHLSESYEYLSKEVDWKEIREIYNSLFSVES